MSALSVVAIGFSALGVLLLLGGVAAFRKKHLLGSAVSVLLGLLLVTGASLAVTLAVATQGYQALTREELALTVETRPTSDQRFDARLIFPDGDERTYQLAGDQVYLDAHILKWKPLANVLGLHTSYELDRVGGRYLELQDEQANPRSLFSLKTDKPLDMFTLRQRYAVFRPLLDAEYGSATFVAIDEPATYQVMVSTSGLLIRRVGATP